jgi:hypothetical protein
MQARQRSSPDCLRLADGTCKAFKRWRALEQLEVLMDTKRFLTAAAVAFITSTSVASAQQSPLPPAPAEKIAPPSNDLNSPSSPGVTGAVTNGSGPAHKDNTKPIDEGGRAGELQENQGKDTTGKAIPPASRDQNRVR